MDYRLDGRPLLIEGSTVGTTGGQIGVSGNVISVNCYPQQNQADLSVATAPARRYDNNGF